MCDQKVNIQFIIQQKNHTNSFLISMASMVQCVLISGLVLLTFHFATSDSNPCSNYKSINQAKRSPEHILARGEKAICDNKLVPGWYRFTNAEQAQIPTTKPGIHHCGTLAPIWIQGKHPMKTGEEVEAIACANINNRIKGCMYSRHVRVKNCGNYYVYHLQPTEGRCMAYCAGKSAVILTVHKMLSIIYWQNVYTSVKRRWTHTFLTVVSDLFILGSLRRYIIDIGEILIVDWFIRIYAIDDDISSHYICVW